jgi:hypothetical protein
MAYEAALHHYCTPSVVDKYEQLNSEAKTKFLHAIMSSQKDNLIQFMSCTFMYADENKPIKKRICDQMKITSRQTCRLILALQEFGINPNTLQDEELNDAKISYGSGKMLVGNLLWRNCFIIKG